MSQKHVKKIYCTKCKEFVLCWNVEMYECVCTARIQRENSEPFSYPEHWKNVSVSIYFDEESCE